MLKNARVDPETQVATDSSKLGAAVSTSSVPNGEVPEKADLRTLFAHELKMDAMRVDEEIFSTTQEDLEQDTADDLVVMPR